jgi:hypothetical protein
MSIVAFSRSAALCLLVLLCSHVVKAEYAEGTLSHDWNPETKKFMKVYRDWEEGAVRDEKTGNYFVTYKDAYDAWNEVLLEPATKTDPMLKSKFGRSTINQAVRYEYKLKNGPKAKQNIRVFLTEVSSINPGGPLAPPGWEGYAVPTFTDSNVRLSWTREIAGASEQLAPGRVVGGFSIESNDLPGVAIMQVIGNAAPTTWLGHAPSIDTLVGKRVAEIEAQNFVPQLAAVPKIVNPSPFDASFLLGGLQQHINQGLVPMKLVDPVLASQLERLLVAAADAARLGNTKGIKENLKDFRKLLKQQYEDLEEEDDFESDGDKHRKKSALIDRLAARVLDFDAKYVLHRATDED